MLIEYKTQRDDIHVKICVDVSINHRITKYTILDVRTKQKRKRTWTSVVSYVCDTWEYRKLDVAERTEYAKKEFLKYVTEDEMKSALAFAHDSIKPTAENTSFRLF